MLRATIGADAFIGAATSSADAKESKPAPDILVAALNAAVEIYPSPRALLDNLRGSAIGHLAARVRRT